jgi:hypothetical protein
MVGGAEVDVHGVGRDGAEAPIIVKNDWCLGA